ncbi:hypothetical protein PINS_up015572 [Pythium insidiosum]|nr:hypothetical protein PINS_up015572 [Pythium insidiosum]
MDARAPVVVTARPKSASVVAGVQRRQWTAPPPELFPPPSKKRPLSSRGPRVSFQEPVAVDRIPRVAANSTAAAAQSLSRTPRTSTTPRRISSSSKANAPAASPPPQRHSSTPRHASFITEVQHEALARGSPKRLSKVTWARLQKASDAEAAAAGGDAEEPGDWRRALAHKQELESAMEARRDVVRSAQVRKTLKQRDVDADDVRPLIEIAYWSPFLEVRRDAAAALASLSRNRTCAVVVVVVYPLCIPWVTLFWLLTAANLEVLAEIGTLGALLSMLSASETRTDSTIARDCAHALANMATLDSVKLKILQAPDGIECIFTLLHSGDLKLRCTAFEVTRNLVTMEELRQAVAKREGFAYMLASCSSKDSRIRLLAAAILHQLAESRENRFLFCHSTHFQTLADILHDPFLDTDVVFRRELLSFIHLLVTEEDNGRKFVELDLVPTLLQILDSPRANHAICLLVVSILECLATNKKNHAALVAANALPRVVQLCFAGHQRALCGDKSGRRLLARRPATAGQGEQARRRGALTATDTGDTRLGTHDIPREATTTTTTATTSLTPSTASLPNNSNGAAAAAMASSSATITVTMSPEMNALLRPAFTVFCEMAKNPTNREHVIRSRLVDYIAARNLYASSDKRVRRAVITLLTFLICRERERERRASARSLSRARSRGTNDLPLDSFAESANPASDVDSDHQEADFRHYIELLARGIVKCLFGILHGNDFSMKVDAIAAIAQLTDDEHSRLTMCKPHLLQALKDFALHPLIQTRTNIAKIIANFAERPENSLKLVDEGMLAVLVKYVCPASRNNDVLVEATRAIAALSMVHAIRNRLVDSGVLGTLIQFCKTPSTSAEVQQHALTAIRNLRHDAAALRIQAIYRGWSVRLIHARAIMSRRRRVRRMTSIRKIHDESNSISGIIDRLSVK